MNFKLIIRRQGKLSTEWQHWVADSAKTIKNVIHKKYVGRLRQRCVVLNFCSLYLADTSITRVESIDRDFPVSRRKFPVRETFFYFPELYDLFYCGTFAELKLFWFPANNSLTHTWYILSKLFRGRSVDLNAGSIPLNKIKGWLSVVLFF